MEIIDTDPFRVLCFVELALQNLKDPRAKMKAGMSCIEMRKNMMLHEYRKHVDGIAEPIDANLRIQDPLILRDHLERAVLSLKRPVSRLQAWLCCAGIRSDIMYYEYGKEWKRE